MILFRYKRANEENQVHKAECVKRVLGSPFLTYQFGGVMRAKQTGRGQKACVSLKKGCPMVVQKLSRRTSHVVSGHTHGSRQKKNWNSRKFWTFTQPVIPTSEPRITVSVNSKQKPQKSAHSIYVKLVIVPSRPPNCLKVSSETALEKNARKFR